MTDPAWPEEMLAVPHDEVVMIETRAEVEALAQRLSHVPFDTAHVREQSGAALVKALRSGRRAAETSDGAEDLSPVAAGSCRTLPSPSFTLQSPGSATATTYSRADAQGGTLEVQARTGTFGGTAYPAGEGPQFLMPSNSSTAWIGAAVPIPPHGSPTHSTLTILEVSIELRIERIWDHAPVEQGSGDDLVFVSSGDGDLPLRGNAVAWCRAGLTLYGSGGARSRRSAEIVSAWVNRDGSDLQDHVQSGVLSLRHAVAISRELTVAGLFVDLSCIAAAEIAPDMWDSAFAVLKCRSGDGFPPPSHVLVDPEQIRLRLCEMPALAERELRAAATTSSGVT